MAHGAGPRAFVGVRLLYGRAAMIGEDDDLAGVLPPQPPPAPTKREAAMAEAMRRFDGRGAAAPQAPPVKPRRWLHNRPQLAGLAIASLVLVLGVPVAWLAIDRGEFRAASGLDRSRIDLPTPPAVADRAPAVVPEPDQLQGPQRAPVEAASPPLTRAALPSPAPGGARSGDAKASPSPPPPPPPPPPAPPAMLAPAPSAPVVAAAPAPPALREERRAEPNRGFSISRSAAAPPAVAAKSTAADMVRNQASAASISDAGAVRGRAAHDENADVVVSGTRLQRGDAVGAVASRDRAGAQMPKPALGLLDRGLARARAGDNAGALADLDQAVRLAPRSARVHQERARVLRALGEERRAKAEFARAAELDPALGDGDN